MPENVSTAHLVAIVHNLHIALHQAKTLFELQLREHEDPDSTPATLAAIGTEVCAQALDQPYMPQEA